MTETVLDEAARLIDGDRLGQYGKASESFERIGDLWSAYLGACLTPFDVANMMILLKVSRAKSGLDRGDVHRDSYVDIAGYAALAEQIKAEIDELHAAAGVVPLADWEKALLGPRVMEALTFDHFSGGTAWADADGDRLDLVSDRCIRRTYSGEPGDYTESDEESWVIRALTEYGPYTEVLDG
ncbi:hypothetical protein A5630_25315 [Mycolicibacterium mucogenicum]|uniref:DUF6378 domain-containing protein n=1 Tax=Mycolicibacterium mucogenicum TaxID=56689 RepID=A0A1A3GY19_MYCMU|nr:DUF6378 domain-containing protein [Mycolicibacterium mucogenicum]OBJ40273.1 hypothetical protein A5630_25315 [Mycolicibacterium mucogenicum]